MMRVTNTVAMSLRGKPQQGRSAAACTSWCQ